MILSSFLQRDKFFVASAWLTLVVLARNIHPILSANDFVEDGNNFPDFTRPRRHLLDVHRGGKGGNEAADSQDRSLKLADEEGWLIRPTKGEFDSGGSDREMMHPAGSDERSMVTDESDHFPSDASWVGESRGPPQQREEMTGPEDSRWRWLVEEDRPTSQGDRIVTMAKSQSYYGELNPRGTVIIRTGEDSTVFAMKVQGMDPMCGGDFLDMIQTTEMIAGETTTLPTSITMVAKSIDVNPPKATPPVAEVTTILMPTTSKPTNVIPSTAKPKIVVSSTAMQSLTTEKPIGVIPITTAAKNPAPKGNPTPKGKGNTVKPTSKGSANKTPTLSRCPDPSNTGKTSSKPNPSKNGKSKKKQSSPKQSSPKQSYSGMSTGTRRLPHSGQKGSPKQSYSRKPSGKPSGKPSQSSTTCQSRTSKPTSSPITKTRVITTPSPTSKPTSTPTAQPTTSKPTPIPSMPIFKVISYPPTSTPTSTPTSQPTTSKPTPIPTGQPTTSLPTTLKPTSTPTSQPTTSKPSSVPTGQPTTSLPTTLKPTSTPTSQPTTSKPSSVPTGQPTTSLPTTSTPTSTPTSQPTTSKPSSVPTGQPTTSLPTTSTPTSTPTSQPTTSKPSSVPTSQPTTSLPTTSKPTSTPTSQPTTSKPSPIPTGQPTTSLPTTLKPTSTPTSHPTSRPTDQPVCSLPRTPTEQIVDCGNPLFIPQSPMTSYVSADCGPRGSSAHFDESSETGLCPHGWEEILNVPRPSSGSSTFAAVLDGCQYWSYKVYRCLPPVVPTQGNPQVRRDAEVSPTEVSNEKNTDGPQGDHLPLDRNRMMKLQTVLNSEYSSLSDTSSFDPSSLNPFRFDPRSTLCGYISDDCGPRGDVALADLSHCEFGHEKVLWVPWQDDNVIVEISGCGYFSLEVYTCLPEPIDSMDAHDFPYEPPPPAVDLLSGALVSDDDVDDLDLHLKTSAGGERRRLGHESYKSCAVIVATGSCSQPGNVGFILGTTAETEHIYQHSFFEDDNIVLIHDHDGNVIACGAVGEDQEPTACLCGTCADCGIYDVPSCNKHDSCMFNGNEDAKPHSLYLKLQFPDEYLTQVNVYFAGEEHDVRCVATVNKDEDGLFHISKPAHCDHDTPGLGAEIYVDYKGDDNPDFALHTSCSMPLYAGMKVQGSPFVVEGYCMSDTGSSCAHMNSISHNICSAVRAGHTHE